jgi:Cu(I)/Ag(I) efflux system membrane fusion protein
MKTIIASSITLALGLTAGVWFTNYQADNLANSTAKAAELTPLYWVAPMDANYRRDEPGKSPMGMDLVPVYPDVPVSASAKKEPLYWVAPMDANYRRDEPGKSPMGMDLVPVYGESSAAASDAGLVTISPRIENNLGVRTQTVSQRPFIPQINTVGLLEFNQHTLWQINSRVSGWIEKLYIKEEGEQVTKGQKLLSLYSPELVKAQEELLNALRIGNKTLISSSKNRLSALGISKEQIRQISSKRKAKQNVTVFAPESGFITKLGVREGAYITPAAQIIEAGQLDEIWLQAEVFESQAGLVQVGDKGEMQLDSFPGRTWHGEVDYIYPELNAATRTLKVRVKFSNEDKQLKPNMFAKLKLLSQTQSTSLQVPREAVIRAGNFDRVVLAKGDGQYQSVRVTIGRESAGYVEVMTGLAAGNKVVTSAQFLIDSESSLTADFSRIDPVSSQQQQQQSPQPAMAMDHSAMNHAAMDHSTMDHSGMEQQKTEAETSTNSDTEIDSDDALDWLDFDDDDVEGDM